MRKVTKKDTVQLGLKEGERPRGQERVGTEWTDTAGMGQRGRKTSRTRLPVNLLGDRGKSWGDAGGCTEGACVLRTPFGNAQESRCGRRAAAGVRASGKSGHPAQLPSLEPDVQNNHQETNTAPPTSAGKEKRP